MPTSSPGGFKATGKGNAFDEIAGAYDQQLAQGLRVSGETRDYFERGRIAALRRWLPADCAPSRILDFGCGLGDTSLALCHQFPSASVVGVDASQAMLDHARAHHQHPGLRFRVRAHLDSEAPFDLCYVNGVFHHIPPGERVEAARLLAASLRPAGILALFENNPLNPGTRLVMRRIPFDRDAVPLWHWEARRLLARAGYRTCWPTRFLFYFPRWLSGMRPLEGRLSRVPLGAQYLLMARPAAA